MSFHFELRHTKRIDSETEGSVDADRRRALEPARRYKKSQLNHWIWGKAVLRLFGRPHGRSKASLGGFGCARVCVGVQSGYRGKRTYRGYSPYVGVGAGIGTWTSIGGRLFK